MSRDFKPKALLAALDAQRTARRMTWADVAQAIGVSEETIREIPERDVVETDGVLQITRWLGLNIESFVGEAKDRVPGPDPGDFRSTGRVLRFDTKALHAAIDARRKSLGLTWQAVSEEIGSKRATATMLMGLPKAQRIDLYTMLDIVGWLGSHTTKFTRLTSV
jgi:transcriptional regulator with XRE-family HTH domain